MQEFTPTPTPASAAYIVHLATIKCICCIRMWNFLKLKCPWFVVYLLHSDCPPPPPNKINNKKTHCANAKFKEDPINLNQKDSLTLHVNSQRIVTILHSWNWLYTVLSWKLSPLLLRMEFSKGDWTSGR